METNGSGTSDNPSILIKLRNSLYAFNSINVLAIMTMPECTPMPHSAFGIVGVFVFRGRSIPLIDIREVFQYPTLDQEYIDFSDMIDQRIQGHVNWVTELERSINAGEKFTLATDPKNGIGDGTTATYDTSRMVQR